MQTTPNANLTSVLGDLASVLNEMRTPVFLVATDSQQSRLTLHVHTGCDVAELRAQADRAMTRSGETVRVNVRAHDLRQLAFPRSLEHWLKRLDVGSVVYDPTMIVTRARSLLQAAKSCRAVLGNVVRGNFFDSDRRTLFVMTRDKGDATPASAMRLKITTIVNEVFGGSAKEASAAPVGPWPINVQVVSALPRRSLIPVDAESATLAHRISHTIRRWLALGTVVVAMTTAPLPAAASLDPGQPGSDVHRAQASDSISDFGFLPGLAVFTDGQRPSEPATFAATGLHLYFGDGNHMGSGLIQLTQKTKKQQCFDPANPSVKWDCAPWSAAPGS